MAKKQSINKLSSALENYLEAIAKLKRENKYARISTIAKSLKVKNSSANAAVKFLAANGLVNHERYGYIDLTASGERVAAEIQRKHDALYKFLKEVLFVESGAALSEACEIEHVVSGETVRRLEKLYFFIKNKYLKTPADIKTLKKYFEKP